VWRQLYCVFPAPANITLALLVQPTLEELQELLPEDEPAWWKSAVEQHRGNQTTAQHSGSNFSKSTLPGWEEFVEPETGVVSMQRVRGGQGGAAAWLVSSSARVARVRGGGREGSYPSPGPEAHRDDDEWDDSGERRLNIPDSDISLDFEEEAPYQYPASALRPLAPSALPDAPADRRDTRQAIPPSSNGSRGLNPADDAQRLPSSIPVPSPVAPAPAMEHWQEKEQEEGPAPGASAVKRAPRARSPCSKPACIDLAPFPLPSTPFPPPSTLSSLYPLPPTLNPRA